MVDARDLFEVVIYFHLSNKVFYGTDKGNLKGSKQNLSVNPCRFESDYPHQKLGSIAQLDRARDF